MSKQNITKKYTFSASGVLRIEDDDIVIEVEDRGEFSLRKMLAEFDGRIVSYRVITMKIMKNLILMKKLEKF